MIAVGVIVYLIYRQKSVTESMGKVDPAAVEIRKMLLWSNDGRVHEQFAMLYAAIMTLERMKDVDLMTSLKMRSQEQQESWIQESVFGLMEVQGFSLGLLKKKLARYVFELARRYYLGFEAMGLLRQNTAEMMLKQGAAFLNEQFASEGVSDICAFLSGK